jgi:hypothetical protein
MRNFIALTAAVLIGTAAGCAMKQAQQTRKDANAVLTAHSAELMARPGVVGVYLGLMPNEKTECIRVMLKEDRADLRSGIPREIDGIPVRLEISGEIRPLTKK